MDHNINKIDSPKRVWCTIGREVLGEKCSLDKLQEGGDETFEARINQPELKRIQAVEA